MDTLTLGQVLSRLEGVRRSGDGYSARCPCPGHEHGDERQSLTAAQGDGLVLLKCHRGHTVEEIAAGLGLEMGDLRTEPRSGGRAEEVDHYDYEDEQGEPVFRVHRYADKTFSQSRPDGNGGWVPGTKGVRRVLYRFPRVLAAAAAGEAIWLAEGEKDVASLERQGVTATCNPMGAGKWRRDYNLMLAGAEVVIVADADAPGRQHAKEVAHALRSVDCKVLVTEPLAGFKDVSEHLGAGHGLDELVAWGEAVLADTDPFAPMLGHDQVYPADLLDGIRAIDWEEFWDQDRSAEDWVVEFVIPRARQVAMFAGGKDGKSLLTLDVAAAKATGRAVLGLDATPPIDIVYLDYEMTEDDLYERLSDLGYGSDDDLSHLHYYQLAHLPPLDTAGGGQVLEAIALRHRAALVIVDTVGSAVQGEENSADTLRDFRRHSGVRLKAAGIALWRLDHSGKDTGRGQRGTSAKADDVDVVFRLKPADNDGMMTLVRTHSRLSWVPPEVKLRREDEPLTRHVLAPTEYPPGTKAVADDLDQLGVAPDASVDVAQKALQEAGRGRRRTLVVYAQKYRRRDP